MTDQSSNLPSTSVEPLQLHLGGKQAKPGWKILNIQPGPDVDYVGSCTDLSQFANGSVDAIYASHVYEHLSYSSELPIALKEAYRVLKPDGKLYIGVPNLEVLCKLMLTPGLDLQQRFHVQRMMFGGQIDAFDYHKVGLTQEILFAFLGQAGFRRAEQHQQFNLFDDTTHLEFLGAPISLNVIAFK